MKFLKRVMRLLIDRTFRVFTSRSVLRSQGVNVRNGDRVTIRNLSGNYSASPSTVYIFHHK
ncbi:hypothetical protein IQ272_16415 [Chroococcidiopsidales cyanobacterium LEGE 13417]|uniref:hypothetical protein n=1 Tax=Chroococcidiopsis sp. CCALA 051 TaxID=869949 RepID=UPI0011B1D20E|nr:hypothetical protein [Chroococcidiopsis sp. CCALA 051]MBE9017694.1 hypothetical protein [Chroococcidiopsidales cyanobacterium LEGE 13417]